jgi:hypothetical protein
MTTKIILIIAAIVFSFTGCELAENTTSYDYSIDQVLQCFCPSEGVVRLFVQNDSIRNVIRISDNANVNIDRWSQYRTIEGLNREIINLDTTKYSLVVTYHPTDNYPLRVFINPKPVVIDSITYVIDDGGYSYETSNYTKLK